MAKRILNRRQLREDADAAAQAEPAPAAEPAAAGAPRKAKAAATPRPRKPARKKEPVRWRARWGVFDGGMKQVAVFDYNQRAAAEQKVDELITRKKGPFFLQMVKEPMPETAPVAPPGAP